MNKIEQQKNNIAAWLGFLCLATFLPKSINPENFLYHIGIFGFSVSLIKLGWFTYTLDKKENFKVVKLTYQGKILQQTEFQSSSYDMYDVLNHYITYAGEHKGFLLIYSLDMPERFIFHKG